MKNNKLISEKLDEALTYLYEQESKLKPFIEKISLIIRNKLKEEDLSAKDAFEIFLKLQEQYTNSILLITKIKEIIDFKF